MALSIPDWVRQQPGARMRSGGARSSWYPQAVPSWSGPLDLSMAGNVLLPAANSRIAPTTFEQWLAAGAR